MHFLEPRAHDEPGQAQAARQLHISQPSVTQAIHEIEDHYGLLLFERLGRHIFQVDINENLLQQLSYHDSC
ncbi:helix-turn-helix domain-containing protein [Megasphaera sp.]|uniref:helix-turn-helix domain-containing protein n=1 Tax=Megasphaera sp. TaxID=2023260 RepID=UPI003F06252E